MDFTRQLIAHGRTTSRNQVRGRSGKARGGMGVALGTKKKACGDDFGAVNWRREIELPDLKFSVGRMSEHTKA